MSRPVITAQTNKKPLARHCLGRRLLSDRCLTGNISNSPCTNWCLPVNRPCTLSPCICHSNSFLCLPAHSTYSIMWRFREHKQDILKQKRDVNIMRCFRNSPLYTRERFQTYSISCNVLEILLKRSCLKINADCVAVITLPGHLMNASLRVLLKFLVNKKCSVSFSVVFEILFLF